MEYSEAILNSNKRKQDILRKLDSYRKDLEVVEMLTDPLRRKESLEKQISNDSQIQTHVLEKQSLIQKLDKLKLENQLLVTRVAKVDELEATRDLLKDEMEACKRITRAQVEKINSLQSQNDSLETSVLSLQEELKDLQLELDILRRERSSFLLSGDMSNSSQKKLDNSERLAMQNQQQALILELEKLKADQAKYSDLIRNIESAVANGKSGIVSTRGHEVTTLSDLALEIANVKKQSK